MRRKINLYLRHKNIRDDSDSQEKVDQSECVEDGEEATWKKCDTWDQNSTINDQKKVRVELML